MIASKQEIEQNVDAFCDRLQGVAADDEVLASEVTARPDLATAQGSEGQTLLHLAARNGLLRTASALLAGGADASARDAKRRTPLHEAVLDYERSAPTLLRLLRAGANVDARDVYWETPLMTACVYSNLYAVALLLASDARLDYRKRGGMDALALAERTAASARRNPRKYAQQLRECAVVLSLPGGGR